jgi:small-conductance mechanosensitive channel
MLSELSQSGSLFSELLKQALLLLPKMVASLGVLFLFWLGGVVAFKVIRRVGVRSRLDATIIKLIARSAKSSMILLGVISALGTLGVDVAALVAGLGLTGFALGFALRDAVSNLLAGVLILIYRPFEPDDRISVSGLEGIVVEIDLRYTTLQAQDRKFLVPNSMLFTKVITLWEGRKLKDATGG